MKIAIVGQNVEAKKEIVKKFMGLCTNYGTPSETIYDDEVCVPKTANYDKNLTDVEEELYRRMSFLATQMDKYCDKENIVYVGHSLDILVEAIMYSDYEAVSEEFVEKMIYWNKKLMKKLDLIYWLPWSDKIIEEEELKRVEALNCDDYAELTDEDIEMLNKLDEHLMEVVYNNIWTDYTKNFEKSSILPSDCPGIGVFETANPDVELSEIVKDLDDTKGKDTRLDDIAKLDKIIKDNRLLKMMKDALKENTIPLPNGEVVTRGQI